MEATCTPSDDASHGSSRTEYNFTQTVFCVMQFSLWWKQPQRWAGWAHCIHSDKGFVCVHVCEVIPKRPILSWFMWYYMAVRTKMSSPAYTVSWLFSPHTASYIVLNACWKAVSHDLNPLGKERRNIGLEIHPSIHAWHWAKAKWWARFITGLT